MKISTQQWLEYAKTDLLNCERVIDDEQLTNIVAFHSQQAVEKCFKALIEELELDIAIPRIHSLIRLHNVIESHLPETIEIRELLVLDKVYTSSRYPSDIGMIATGKPNLKESKQLFEIATRICDLVIQTIDN